MSLLTLLPAGHKGRTTGQAGADGLTCAEKELIHSGDLCHDQACDSVRVVHKVHSCARLQVPQPDAAVIMTCTSISAHTQCAAAHCKLLALFVVPYCAVPCNIQIVEQLTRVEVVPAILV